MQFLLNTVKSTNLKGKTFAIALILLLTMSSAVAIMPKVKAQAYSYTPTKGTNGLWNIPTYPGLTVAPDPVGVGQPVQAIMIIELLPPSQGVEASTGVYGGWQGYTLTVTDPNGTVTTLGPFLSDVSGTYQVSYTRARQHVQLHEPANRQSYVGSSRIIQLWSDNQLEITAAKTLLRILMEHQCRRVLYV